MKGKFDYPFVVTKKSPSNIAIIKYWGKHGKQLPNNPSVSFTLSRCYTETKIKCEYCRENVLDFYFEGKENAIFRDKINKFLVDNKQYFGFLDGMHLEISSSNSFPHSSGIASSASSMSALVMCLLEIEKTVNHDDTSIDLNKASFLSRFASGSASRSVYPVMALWGETPSVIGSSDEFAVSVENMVAPIFKTYHDSILIVSSKEKSISSRVGHSLMDNHPWAVSRYEKARHNTEVLIQALQQGDIDTFIEIAESEALQLHELMHTSNPPFDLMMPETMKIIEAVRHYRTCCNIPLCFTLDAGPNVHLLYPDSVADDVVDFIKKDLVKYCVDNKWIDDIVG